LNEQKKVGSSLRPSYRPEKVSDLVIRLSLSVVAGGELCGSDGDRAPILSFCCNIRFALQLADNHVAFRI
jgi:hypothetical protein